MNATAPQISVIIPVYNVAGHVGACIRSLLEQSWTDFEALVIDDGSTDDSGELARQAYGDDPRFRLIRQENRGLSGARNTGLQHARGAFIAFLDSDDRYAPRFLERMHAALVADGGDWVACAIALCFPDGREIPHPAIHGAPAPGPAHMISFSDSREVVRHFPSAWNKLYRRDLITQTRFTEGTWFEDHEFFWALIARSPRMVYLPEPLYLHSRERPDQITGADDERVFEQFSVLDRLAGLVRASGLGHADEGFARLATRLIHERAEVVRNPERRARFLAEAAAFLGRHQIDYSPDWDPDISHAPGLMMKGTLPLSVVLRDVDPPGASVQETLDALASQTMIDFELLVPDPQRLGLPAQGGFLASGTRVAPMPGSAGTQAATQAGTLAGTLAQALAVARGRYLVMLQPGDLPGPHCFRVWVNAMERHGARLGLSGFERGDWNDGYYHPGVMHHAPFNGELASIQPAGGLVDLTPERALRFSPEPSAQIVRRDLFTKASLPTALQGVPECVAAQIMTLQLAGVAGQAVYFPYPAVAIAPRAWPGTTARGLARALRSLPRHPALSGLPRGWQAVVFARGVQARFSVTSGRVRKLWQIACAATAARVFGLKPVTGLALDGDLSPRLRRALGKG